MLTTDLSFAGFPTPVRQLHNGTRAIVRTATLADAPGVQAFVRSLSARTRYYRFFSPIHELPLEHLHRVTHIDGDRSMTLLALAGARDSAEIVGVAEYVAKPHTQGCEFAIVIQDAWQRSGLGALLLDSLVDRARGAGLAWMEGDVLEDNHAMLGFARSRGFGIHRNPDEPELVRVRLAIRPRGDGYWNGAGFRAGQGS